MQFRPSNHPIYSVSLMQLTLVAFWRHVFIPRRRSCVKLLACALAVCSNTVRGETIDFEQSIRPIFEASCFQCHGPEKKKGVYG